MMAEFTMPALGAAMENGTLVEWRKQPGERVERGEIIAEIETEKGAIEVECFQTGVVDRLLVEPGSKVPVGAPMAILRDVAEAPAPVVTPAPAPPATPAPAPAPPAAAPPAAAPPPAAPPPVTRAAAAAPARPSVRASPFARRRAGELGVDLTALAGTGPHGAITVEDVERAGAAGAAAAAEPAADRMRRAVGAAMARSKREIPHFYASHLLDVDAAMRWLAEQNSARALAERILPAALLIKAAALALRRVPELNAHWTGEAAPPLADINVGVATFLRGGGLIAPAIPGADRLSLADLMAALKDLVDRARGNRLRSSELTAGTITITNLGERGADEVLPVIFPPQVAMIGFGRIAPRPMVADGAVVARTSVHATLAADHRAADGHAAGRLFGALESLLAAPEKL
jgi:pyruvate dehydrogenase E2 component (dihydrolipoamide acetyltransferase)